GTDDPVLVGFEGLARVYILARLKADVPVVGMDHAEEIGVSRNEALAADAEYLVSRVGPFAFAGDQIPLVAAGAGNPLRAIEMFLAALKLRGHLLQLFFTLLEFSDVEADADDAAVRGTAFDDLTPTA